MADDGVRSRYVRLGKDQNGPSVEEIVSGELNQPVQVPELVVHKCRECGQSLPLNHRPPAVEPWTSGIFGCAENTIICWQGLFCPCVLFGRNVEYLREDIPWTRPCVCHAIFVEGGLALAAATALLNGIDPGMARLICEGLLFTWWMCGIYTGLFRQELQKKYHLKNSPCDPCMVHCCLHWCALCQEHREMMGHLRDGISSMPAATVSPPPLQEMELPENHTSAASKDSTDQTHTEEVQAV